MVLKKTLCLAVVLGLSVALTPTWAGEAERYFNEGLAYQRKGQLDAAIASYKEAIRLEPDVAQMHNSLALAYIHNVQVGSAIASFKEAIRLKPDYAGPHYGLGRAYVRTGNRKGALAEYRWLRSRNPGWAEKLHSEIQSR